jgi:GT2 family glycosyltransferase
MSLEFTERPSHVGRGAVPARVDVVIVAWHHADLLPACLESLGAGARRHHVFDRIVVVDNGSDPPCGPGAVDGLPPLTLLTNRHNAGFSAGCNQGARGSRADYVLFLNPDTCVGSDSVDAGVTILESDPGGRFAIAGIQLVNEHGVPEATCGRFPTVANLFWQMTGLSSLSPARWRGMRMIEWDHRQTREVDFVSGACLLVRRDVFERLGGFDERLFVYLEDADLALRARTLGYGAVFSADASVVHPGGWATGRDRAWRLAQSWRSLVAYGWKHFGPARAILLTLCVLFLAPIARVAQATLQRSARDAVAIVSAHVLLWRLLAADVSGRPERQKARASDTATLRSLRRPASGRQSPARVSSRPADGIQ